MSLRIRIIRPSGREKDNLLPQGIADLEGLGHTVLFQDAPAADDWRYASASIEVRAQQLMDALTERDSDLVLCARGGYGASDLLPLVDWTTLRGYPEKPVVGFSDISAIHSALFANLGWKGLHGPMPATSLWGKNGRTDIDQLFQLLQGYSLRQSMPLQPIDSPEGNLDGWLFGGCFSVLTNLIGTPYFPASLQDSILIWEDISEHPARLMRYLNQWLQSGILTGVRAIILGTFLDLGEEIENSAPMLLNQFAKRCALPTYHCPNIGHISPNQPFQIGAAGKIRDNSRLEWTYHQRSIG